MQFFGDDASEKDFMHKCTMIIFQFSTEYIPRMLSGGVQKILFAQMLKYTDDIHAQRICTSTLAYFYTEYFPSLDPSDVSHFLTAISGGLERFLHDEQFLHTVANIFKTLVFIEEYSSTICCHLVEKGYTNIFADQLKVLLSYVDTVDEMQQAETVYTNIMKTFRGIMNHQHLCTDMVLENIKDVIQVGMARYETNTDVQYTTCMFFRLVFFPFSETRRVAPTLKIVKLPVEKHVVALVRRVERASRVLYHGPDAAHVRGLHECPLAVFAHRHALPHAQFVHFVTHA